MENQRPSQSESPPELSLSITSRGNLAFSEIFRNGIAWCSLHHLPPPPSLSDEIDLSTDGLAPSNSTLGNFLHQVLGFTRMICQLPQGSDLVNGCRDSSIILIEFKNLVLKYQRVTVQYTFPPIGSWCLHHVSTGSRQSQD